MKHRFFYDVGTEGGGGGLPPSMSDLGDPSDPLYAGNNEPPPPNLEAAAQAQAAQQLIDTEANDGQGGLKPGYAKDDQGRIYKDANYTPSAEVEGLNADGTLQEGYERNAAGEVVKVEDDSDDDNEEDESTAFFARVAELAGTPVEVTYPEGVTPISPEGIVIRDAAVRAQAEQAFEAQIKADNPRGYAYLIHTTNGGTDDEFFQGAPAFTLPTEDELSTSAELQSTMYRFDLKNRGLDEDMVEVLVAKAIKDNNLKDKAVASFKYIEAKQVEQNTAIELRRKQAEQETQQRYATMEASITEAIDKEISFIVPEAAKPEFRKFLNSKLTYDDSTGEFFVVDKINKESLKSTIESLLFQYKKGDLATLIRKEAKSQASHKLRLKLDANNKGAGQSSNAGNKRPEFVPLGSL